MPPESDIIVNPQELLQFAVSLRAFNQQTEVSTKRLKAQFKRLSETWRDRKHQEFAKEFESTMAAFDRLNLMFKTEEPLLRKRAQSLIEAYR